METHSLLGNLLILVLPLPDWGKVRFGCAINQMSVTPENSYAKTYPSFEEVRPSGGT